MEKQERKDYLKELKERFDVFQINMATALWVDKETGVEYLRILDGELRPLVDADGKPHLNKHYKNGTL